MALTWQDEGERGWAAWSDQLLVGWVLVRNDGSIWFDATYAVHMRHIARKGAGVVPTIEAGKKAIELAWATWLTYAGLNSKTEGVS